MDYDYKFTREVLDELRISYSTLFRIRKRLGMFPKNGGYKLRYSKKDIKRIKNALKN
jgi:hypothetical protein